MAAEGLAFRGETTRGTREVGAALTTSCRDELTDSTPPENFRALLLSALSLECVAENVGTAFDSSGREASGGNAFPLEPVSWGGERCVVTLRLFEIAFLGGAASWLVRGAGAIGFELADKGSDTDFTERTTSLAERD